MAKPTPYFPNTALPNLQELATETDTDPLGIVGSITQRGDVTLTAGYASSGATTVSVSGGFAAWPAFGLFENLTTGEQIAFTRTNNNDLNVLALGRGQNGTTPAAGSVGHVIRFIEKRLLGRLAAQLQAEIAAHDDVLRGSIAINEAINGNMRYAQRGTSAASTGTPAITAAQAYRLDRFFVRPAGAAVTVEQSTTVPNNDSEFSLQINGAASVTTVNVGQRFEAARAKRLRKKLTFSAYVHNVSGLDFTPKLQLYTPTNVNNFGAVNAIALDVNLQNCADNAWTKVSYTFDPSAFTDIAKGFELSIQIPSGRAVAGDTIRVTQFMLQRGSYATPFSDAGDLEFLRCARHCYSPSVEGNAAGVGVVGLGFGRSTTDVQVVIRFPQPMFKRITFSASAAGHFNLLSGGSAQAVSSFTWGGANDTTDTTYFLAVAAGTVCAAGDAVLLYANNASARLIFEAEL